MINLIQVLIIKPAVFIVGIFIIRRWKLIINQPGIRLLRWSIIVFLAGEVFCGIDIYLFHRMTLMNEILHETAMMLSFAGFIWGSMTAANLDSNCLVMGCSQKDKCLLDPRDCPQAQAQNTMISAIFLGLISLAVMPFFVQPFITTETLVAGMGNWVLGSFKIIDYPLLWDFRTRLAPLIPILALSIVFLRLFAIVKINKTDRILIYLGTGFLLFILNRLFLLYVFRENGAIGNFFEEIQELLFMIIVLVWSKTKLPADHNV
ncbi:MAG: hypothetical protein GXO90_05370 [FCB group bacterium]|nr:hypothetical protein [FCB group bacterium]